MGTVGGALPPGELGLAAVSLRILPPHAGKQANAISNKRSGDSLKRSLGAIDRGGEFMGEYLKSGLASREAFK